jgi:hypothetical protein
MEGGLLARNQGGAAVDGSAWTTIGDGDCCVVGGGSWGENEFYLRAANRGGTSSDSMPPQTCSRTLGFGWPGRFYQPSQAGNAVYY